MKCTGERVMPGVIFLSLPYFSLPPFLQVVNIVQQTTQLDGNGQFLSPFPAAFPVFMVRFSVPSGQGLKE